MKLKIWTPLVAVLLCIAMLCACTAPSTTTQTEAPAKEEGKTEDPAPAAEPADGETVELSMWFWGSDAEKQAAIQRVLVDKFNEAHPGYNLTIEYRSSVNKDMAVALSADEGPDIIYESSPALALEYIAAGKYANLDKYSEQYGWKDKIIPCMYDSGCVNGSLYSLAMGMNIIGIVYNKDVLEANGWSVPTTMAELTAIMDEAIAKGMYGSATGNKGWQPTNEDYTSLFLTAFAGPEATYEALTDATPWTDARIVHAVEESAEWYQKGYLCSDYLSCDWSDAAMLLAEGKAPFFFGPYKFIQNLTSYATGDMADSFCFTAFPSEDPAKPGYYTIGATGILAINANSKYQDLCADFLDMMFSNDFVHDISVDWPGYWAVPLTTLNEVDTSDLTGLSKNFMEAVMDAVASLNTGSFGYYNSSYMTAEAFDVFYKGIESVWMGEMSATDMLQEVDEAFQKEYDAGSTLVVPPQG